MTGAVGVRTDERGVGSLVPTSVARAVRRGAITPETLLDGPEAVRASDAYPLLFVVPPAPAGLPARLDWRETAPHSWRRLAARLVDTALLGYLLLMLVLGTFALVRPDEGGAVLRFLDTKLGLAVSSVLETVLTIPLCALAVARCGSTPGKSLFGIRLRQDGRRPDLRTMLRREWSVAARGQAFGVLLLAQLANASAYRHLKREGRTPWDAANGLTVHHRPATWGMTLLLLILLLFALVGTMAFLPW
ncbi:RDD family protein [Methylorubrum sp. SB2]|uniref:RDD family protein n=1 Tax=Methylorubrum subtropicum TaxID=3138812 RepID=UPI00313B8398